MTINKTGLNLVNFEALKGVFKAPTTKIGDMNARIKCVTMLIDQEIEDYTAVIGRLAHNRADTAQFTDTVSTRLVELQALRAVFKTTLKAINSDEEIKAGGKELKILHQQSLIDVALSELQAGVMLRGLSTWHNDELYSNNMDCKYFASPYSEQLSTVIQANDSEYVRAVAFRMYAQALYASAAYAGRVGKSIN